MRLSLPLVLLAGLTAACAAPEPFVDHGTTVTVDKPPSVTASAGFSVCYSDSTPAGEVERLAEEQCAAYGLQVLKMEVQRWQCRATSPHTASYRCIDPDMRSADGSFINPFDRKAVAGWEKATGRTARNRHQPGPQVVVPPAPAPDALSAPPPPPPAPVSGTALSPADIAGKPAAPAPPLPLEAAPPAPPPLPAGGDFSLEPGSWGDHFEE